MKIRFPKNKLPVNVASIVALHLFMLATMGGCVRFDLNTEFTTPERLEKGLVVILPGIEGESGSGLDVRKGLNKSGIPYGLVLYRWGENLPGKIFLNQTDVEGNRREAVELAGHIIAYQKNHTGKPVFIIGHSGGGGIAIFTLEAMAAAGGSPIEGAFLLSSCISCDYDPTGALKMTRLGLVNLWHHEDLILDSGTKAVGNVDGGTGQPAGKAGFSGTYKNVFERQLTAKQFQEEFNSLTLSHFAITNADLIEKYAPPWILSQIWPPTNVGK